MNISINIQSYRRAGRVKTLRLVPTANLWVHGFEGDEYQDAYPERQVLFLPDATRGNLPLVKNHILETEFKAGADAVLLLDDDISKVAYFEKRDPIAVEGQDLVAFVEKYSQLCREWGFFLWGVNVNMDKQCYREYTPFGTVQYVSSSFSCFLKGNNCLYDPQFPLKEDYDMTLQQCNRNRGLLRLNKWHYVKLGAENVGGCAGYRSIEKEKSQMLLLQKKWGSVIVQSDSLDYSRSHSSGKENRYDINPVIRVPIVGV